MEVYIERQEQATIITITGQLNSHTTAHIQEDVLAAVHAGDHVLLDMSRVTYLSSAGLRMLLLLYRRIRDSQGVMALTGLSEEVSDMMSITGFLDLFTTFENRMIGLQALKKAG